MVYIFAIRNKDHGTHCELALFLGMLLSSLMFLFLFEIYILETLYIVFTPKRKNKQTRNVSKSKHKIFERYMYFYMYFAKKQKISCEKRPSLQSRMPNYLDMFVFRVYFKIQKVTNHQKIERTTFLLGYLCPIANIIERNDSLFKK